MSSNGKLLKVMQPCNLPKVDLILDKRIVLTLQEDSGNFLLWGLTNLSKIFLKKENVVNSKNNQNTPKHPAEPNNSQ